MIVLSCWSQSGTAGRKGHDAPTYPMSSTSSARPAIKKNQLLIGALGPQDCIGFQHHRPYDEKHCIHRLRREGSIAFPLPPQHIVGSLH